MSRAKKYWAGYRRMTDFPRASQNKAERNIGIIVYSLSFLLACGLLVTMLIGESQTYINYGTSGGDYNRAMVHRPPDIVICPNSYPWSDRMYEVLYDEKIIGALNMTHNHINMITKKFHSSCQQAAKCPELSERCSDTPLASFCRVLEASVAKKEEGEQVAKEANMSKAQNLQIGNLEISEYKSAVLESSVKTGLFEMLWLAISDPRYTDTVHKLRGLRPEAKLLKEDYLILCFYYNDKGIDKSRNEECSEHQESFWLGTAYCSLIRGSKITETYSPYIGFAENGKRIPFRYWVGNMETTTLTEQLLMTSYMGSKKTRPIWEKKLGELDLVTGVGHYSMIRWTEVAGQRSECQIQPNIRGLSLPLEHCKEVPSDQALTSWYYDLTYQKRPFPSAWIYPQTIRKMEKYQCFTAYTQFQVGAGLLSCFVGFSFLQMVELLLNFFKKMKLTSQKLLTWSQILSLLCAIVLTVVLTSLDLYWYFGSRYTTIFNQKNETLSFPVVQLCNDWSSPYVFINTTKMAEYNASVNFYLFMRLAGWQIGPYINVAGKENRVNESLISVEVKEWMRRNWEPKVGVNTTCDGQYESYCPRSHYPWFDLVIAINRWENKEQKRVDSEEFRTNMLELVVRDVKTVAVAIGIPNPTIVQLMQFFTLDPRKLVRCSMKGRNIEDCGRFARYFLETGSHEFCLSLQIPQKESSKFNDGAHFDNSFHVSYDSKAYKEHSDYNSYHGTGVDDEKERDKGFNYCEGVKPSDRIPLRGGWVRSPCPAGRSWKVKVAHPDWAENYIQIQHPKMGLINHQLHTLNLQPAFSTVLQLDNERCFTQDRLTCQFPKEEATAVYKAIQFYIWCGCFYCAHEENTFLNHLRNIFDESVSCCTPNQYIYCLEGYQKAMKWNGEDKQYEKDKNYHIAKNMVYKIKPFSNVELLRQMNPENITIWMTEIDLLDKKVMEKLAEWTRTCFKLPCEEKSYTLLSYQNEATEEEVVNVTIVFDSTMGVGTEEIDRLDPAQLLGILLCSYSVTIGIGVVGLLEVLVVIISKIKGSNDIKLGKTIHEHLVRGLAPMTGIKPVSKIQPESQSAEEEFNAVPKGTEGTEAKVESLRKPVEVDVSGLMKTDDNPSSDLSIKHTEQKLDSGADKVTSKQTAQHAFLLISLLIGIILAIILVIYFFFSLETEFTADIQVSAKYERPSVALCVDSKNKALDLWTTLEKSKCWMKGIRENKCSDIFLTFIHAKKDQYCFMLDNSRSVSSLDSHEDDLKIDMPKTGPEANLFINGLNNSQQEDMVAFFKWKPQNVSVTYNLEAYQQESGCVSEISDRSCAQCSFPEALKRPHPIECCATEKNVSRFVPKKTCYELHFGVSYVPSITGEGDSKSLTIRASSDFLIIYKVKSKHNIPMLISISGGFISSFTEITFLNILALTGYLFWKTAVKPEVT